MFEKDLFLSLLYDIYSPLLSQRKQEVFEGYFLSDLSLSEIAQEIGTSRQAVRNLISRTREELISFEEKLGLLKKRKRLLSLCDGLEKKDGEERAKALEEIREIL